MIETLISANIYRQNDGLVNNTVDQQLYLHGKHRRSAAILVALLKQAIFMYC